MMRAFLIFISISCILIQAEDQTFLSIDRANISQFFETQILTQKDLSNTLILLDVDNTLITHKPGTWLSSSEHFYGLIDMLVHENHLSKQQAIDSVDRLLMEVYKRTPALLTGPNIPETIKKLKTKGALVIGFTARGTILLDTTLNQLKQMGIQFSPVTSSTLFLKDGLFTVGQSISKGEAANALLKELHDSNIQKVIFLDDKEKHLASVQMALKGLPMTDKAIYAHVIIPPASAFNLQKANQELCDFIEANQSDSEFKAFFAKNAFAQDFWRDCNKSYSAPSSDKY